MWLNSPEHKRFSHRTLAEIGLSAVTCRQLRCVRRTRSHHRDCRFRRQALNRDKYRRRFAPPDDLPRSGLERLRDTLFPRRL